MNTLHPSIKYALFLVMLYAVSYGIFGLQEIPQRRVSTALGTVLGLVLFGLIGRKLTKDPFVGFVGATITVLAMGVASQFLL